MNGKGYEVLDVQALHRLQLHLEQALPAGGRVGGGGEARPITAHIQGQDDLSKSGVISCPMYEWDGRSIVPKEERRRKKRKAAEEPEPYSGPYYDAPCCLRCWTRPICHKNGYKCNERERVKEVLESMKQSALLKMARAEVNRQLADRTTVHTQMCMDAAVIAANEVFSLGPSRVDRFCKAFSDALMEMAEMTVSDTKDIEYTKAKLDDRLRKICGDSFQPWEVRYGK